MSSAIIFQRARLRSERLFSTVVSRRLVHGSKRLNKFFDYDTHLQEKVEQRKANNTFRVLTVITPIGKSPPWGIYNTQEGRKKEIIIWSSNGVLGMGFHPDVKSAVRETISECGVGSSGARGSCGTSSLHQQLEDQLALFHSKEKSYLSTSGFLLNSSTIPAIARLLPGCEIYSASDNHASLVQGVVNSGVVKHIFDHTNPRHLEELLGQSDPTKPKLVVMESVTSMTGIVVPIDNICSIAKKYGAFTYVDEVHAIGLYGPTGAGVGEMLNCTNDMDLTVGSLAKAMGTSGTYIVGKSVVVEAIRSFTPGYIYTTSLPPMTLAGSLASLKVTISEEGRQLRLSHKNTTAKLQNLLVQKNLPTEIQDSHILPVWVGSPVLCTLVARELINNKGHYVAGVNYPTVPKGEERLRITPTPYHTDEMMESLVDDLANLWDQLGIRKYQERILEKKRQNRAIATESR